MEDKMRKLQHREKNRFFLEGFYALGYLWAALFFMEIILRINSMSPLINNGIWYGFLYSGVMAFVFYLLASFFEEKGRTVVMSVFLF